MDYLSYMNFESEAFAFYVTPLITFAYFHHYLTTMVFTWPDVYCLVFSYVIRLFLLMIFAKITIGKGDVLGCGDKYTFIIIRTTSFSLYTAYLSYYLWNDNDSLFSQVCIRSEMISLPLLFYYSGRNFHRIRNFKISVSQDEMDL